MAKRKTNALMKHKNHPLGQVLPFTKEANRMFLGMYKIRKKKAELILKTVNASRQPCQRLFSSH